MANIVSYVLASTLGNCFVAAASSFFGSRNRGNGGSTGGGEVMDTFWLFGGL